MISELNRHWYEEGFHLLIFDTHERDPDGKAVLQCVLMDAGNGHNIIVMAEHLHVATDGDKSPADDLMVSMLLSILTLRPEDKVAGATHLHRINKFQRKWLHSPRADRLREIVMELFNNQKPPTEEK